MRSVFFCSGLALVATCLGADTQYRFTLTVQLNQERPLVVSTQLPPGTERTVRVNDHLQFEIDAPRKVDNSATTVVKLVDISSGRHQVLHTSRRHGPATLERAFTYSVCGGELTFESPSGPEPKGFVE